MEITPALWSAVAATCSAVTAITVARIQAANRRDAARPELVLAGWTRETEVYGEHRADIVRIATVKNVGKGPALHVNINCNVERDGRPVATMSTALLPIIAPGESVEIKADVMLWWQNSQDVGGVRHAPVNVEMIAWDTVGLRHTTLYRALAVPLDAKNVIMPGQIAPGLGLGSRQARAVPVWRLKLARRGQQVVTIVRRMFGKLPPTARPTAIVRPLSRAVRQFPPASGVARRSPVAHHVALPLAVPRALGRHVGQPAPERSGRAV
jgi:hypothetical protein